MPHYVIKTEVNGDTPWLVINSADERIDAAFREEMQARRFERFGRPPPWNQQLADYADQSVSDVGWLLNKLDDPEMRTKANRAFALLAEVGADLRNKLNG